MIYRGYVVRGGRIIAGEDIESATLDDAKTVGYKMIAERRDAHQIDGIEIWQGSSLLYKSGTASARQKLWSPGQSGSRNALG
jgi:hypothetical protein